MNNRTCSICAAAEGSALLWNLSIALHTFYTCCQDRSVQLHSPHVCPCVSMCVPIHFTCSEQLSIGVQAIVIPQLSGTLEQRNHNFQHIRTNCSKSISEDKYSTVDPLTPPTQSPLSP